MIDDTGRRGLYDIELSYPENAVQQAPGTGDEASLFLALSWLFEAKRAGLAVRERSEDVRLARRYAEQYAALNGTRQPLVNVWIDYLER